MGFQDDTIYMAVGHVPDPIKMVCSKLKISLTVGFVAESPIPEMPPPPYCTCRYRSREDLLGCDLGGQVMEEIEEGS